MPALNKNALKWALCFLLLPLVALLFVSGPVESSTPTFRYLWNFGHIGLFALITVMVHLFRPFNSTLEVFSYLAIAFIASFIIEGLQRIIGRDFSTVDILRNLVGCAIALLFVARRYLHISALSFLTFVFALDLLGFASTVWTDISIQRRAPIIENFESEFMAARWRGDLSLQTNHVLEGNFSAQVDFPVGQYPTVSFSNILKDWQGYDSLLLNIYSENVSDIQLTLRLHDKTHETSKNRQYDDRFNQSFTITSGWNTVEVLLFDVRNAPSNRQMDLTQMKNIALFIANNEAPVTLYFDNFRLE